VDAYDELLSTKAKTGGATAEKSAVRASLAVLRKAKGTKILITTRPHHCEELQETFPDAKIATVHGDQTDMKTYIERMMQSCELPELFENEVMTELLKANMDEKW